MLDAVPRGTVEEDLIGQGTAAAIREMRLRGKSKKAIARELDLDIKTVRKWSSEEWKPQRRKSRGEELAAYAEVYGLAADERGVARYVARYSFAPVRPFLARVLGVGHAIVVEFTREAPAQDVMVEQLVLEPGRVPRGRYRVTLGVTDALRNVKSESVAVEITVR